MHRRQSQAPSLPVLFILGGFCVGAFAFMLTVSAGMALADHITKERAV